MIIFLMLPLLFGNFALKWYFPQGIDWGVGRIGIGDTDRDGNHELIFSTYGGSFTIYFYELHLPDVWEIDSVTDLDQPLLWDIGDFDVDGFYDLVMQSSWGPPSVGIAIYESPDSFSYPSQEVWRDTVGQASVSPISVYDMDQDGLTEIVKVGANGIDFVIYESVGNNLYDRVYEDTIQGILTPTSTIAFGDFDEDNKVEFVLGNLSDGTGAAYWLYESPADNTYEFIHLGSVSTKNIKDCFTVPDADGDGKLEFVVKGFVIPSAQIHAFIFEATGDDTYEVIKSFTLPGGDYYGGYSDIGDVDGDSIPEIALEACQNIYVIKSAGNDSFYVWETLSGNNSGSSVRVYDIDGNGFSEVIISGNDQTRIYEYEVGIAEDTKSRILLEKWEIHPNPFRQHTTIQCMMEVNQKPQLKIYDTTGRLVESFNLESSILNQEYWVVWDGTDNYGNRLPAGVYFIRIQSSIGEQSVPVVLLR